MGRILRRTPKLRDVLAANNKADRFLALMAGKEPMAQSVIKPVRAYFKSGVKTEAQVNEDLKSLFKSIQSLRMWRNNRGSIVADGQHIRYGVGPNGASDWIGFKTFIVTPEMVGKKLAVFCALEAKRPGEKPDERQAKFIDYINESGGCAGWADGVDAASEVLK